ncbi:lytic murein transglycosylase [Streptomyces sp. PSKA01]|uniref:Lytic murein transglycosylase n=2 Tax=Streptomyces cupreus TaxID=2759956 RepID=A0A7X1MEH3_9ACTN|nr:lytic transglycosylase domain-containing protein [Streptomyces cupreus]MBC2907988.1 lytic murein transglycosylase [Streptomyces cupreus]
MAGAVDGGRPLYLEPPPVDALELEPSPAPSATHADEHDRTDRMRPVGAVAIPERVLAAYRSAVAVLNERRPGCGLRWPLLAAIGRVESGHARGGQVNADGSTITPILGPRLDGGPGLAAIRDTDNGVYDSDSAWDRAVGPMQFIPSTWHRWGVDGNGDGTADPHNVGDSALAAAHYLCAAGGDVSRDGGLRRAVLAYNHSEQYLDVVLAWMRVYAGGSAAVETSPATQPTHTASPEPRPGDEPSRRDKEPPRQGKEPPRQESPSPSPARPPEWHEPDEPAPSDQPSEPEVPDLPLTSDE